MEDAVMSKICCLGRSWSLVLLLVIIVSLFLSASIPSAS